MIMEIWKNKNPKLKEKDDDYSINLWDRHFTGVAAPAELFQCFALVVG
jgi:hypothetical protein